MKLEKADLIFCFLYDEVVFFHNNNILAITILSESGLELFERY